MILVMWNCLAFGSANDLTESVQTAAKYVHLYHGESLKSVLQNIAINQGEKLQLSSNLSPKLLMLKVSGKYIVVDNKQLLDQLAKQYGFTWFSHSGVISISSQQIINRSIDVAQENMQSVTEVLNNIGLLNSNFGYTEVPSQDKIIVSGPPTYINAIDQEVNKLKVAPSADQFAIYRLRYSSATDLTLTFNGQQLVIPGVATLLADLIGATTPKGAALSDSVTQLGSSSTAYSVGESANNQAVIKSYVTKSGGKINADPRLNTLIIRDKISKLRLYAELIKELDIPAPLIQVDVIEVRLNDDKLIQEGVNWWGVVASGIGVGAANTTVGPLQSNVGTSAKGSDTNSISGYLGQLTPGNFLVTNFKSFLASLQALEQKSIVKTTNHPSLVTIDNLPAIMSNTQTLYITLPASNVAVYNTTSNSSSAVSQAEVTTALSITPHVIQLANGHYDVKLSIVLQSGDIQNPTTAPVTNQNTINSQAVIESGQSLLLAGYSHMVMEQEVSQIPVLGSIPLLGWFFRSTNNREVNETNLYLISPKIVLPSEMLTLQKEIKVGDSTIKLDNKQVVTE